MGVERTGGALVSPELAVKARMALAGRKVDSRLTNTITGKVLTLHDLQRVYGIGPEQLKGLAAHNIYWQDGIDMEELDTLIKLKESSFKDFRTALKGSGKTEAELEKMFDELWGLAVRGQLDQSAWNEIAERYGLKELKMNSSSFCALMGGQDGFSDSERIEGAVEFKLALSNLVLTLRTKVPLSGDEERDKELENGHFKALSNLCDSRNFTIFYMENWDKAAINMLAKMIGVDASKLSDRDILLRRIQANEFGERLGKLAENAKDWRDFLVKMLKAMEESIARGLPTQNMDGVEYYLSLSKRMSFINDILKEKDSPRWNNLVNEMERLFRQNDSKAHLDYEALKKDGI